MDNYFTNGADVKSGSILITDFERVFVTKLLQYIPSDACLINTTWFSIEKTYEMLKKWKTTKSRAFLYSGMDWENTSCLPLCQEVHEHLKNRFDEVVHVGNTGDGHYFSFWLEFIKHHQEYFFDGAYTVKPDIRYHFLCLNNKPNWHRIHLLNNVFEDGSVRTKGNISVLQQDDRYTFDHPIVLEENRSPLMGQMFYEWEKFSETHIANDIVSLGDPRHWSTHFLTVVTESCHHSDVFLSEKIFKPLIGLRPFVAVGDRNLYPKLRELGIDTFEDLFPSVGKDVGEYQERCDNLLADLKTTCDMSLHQLDILYDHIYNRLLENRTRVFELIDQNDNCIRNLNKL